MKDADAEAFVKANTRPSNTEITTEEYEKEIKKYRRMDIDSRLTNLYELINDTFRDKKDLINRDENIFIEYDQYKQTDFGIKLKEFLKIIITNCTKFIDKSFANKSMNLVSAVTCFGSSNISKLYKYLKDDKFTSSAISNMTDQERKEAKTELKQILQSHLINISQNEEDKTNIKASSLREDDNKPPTIVANSNNLYFQKIAEENKQIEEYNENLYGPNKVNPHDLRGGKAAVTSR